MAVCRLPGRPHGAGELLSKLILAIAMFSVLGPDGVAVAERLTLPSGIQIRDVPGSKAQICLAQFGNVLLVFGEAAPDEVDDDVDPLDGANRRSGGQARLVQGTADEFAYGVGADVAAVSKRLETILKSRVAAIDGRCNLSPVQRAKIELAGRGDIERLLGRAADLKGRFEKYPDVADINEFRNWFSRLVHEATISRATMMADPYDAHSLFVKTLRHTLTPEQLGKVSDTKGNLVATGGSQLPVAARAWDVLGLKLEKLNNDNARPLDAFRNKYRGGMRITDVRQGVAAGEGDLKQGDILVGLHHWETARWEDVNFILDQTAALNAAEGIKFYIVRGQEVLYGNLRLAARPK